MNSIAANIEPESFQFDKTTSTRAVVQNKCIHRIQANGGYSYESNNIGTRYIEFDIDSTDSVLNGQESFFKMTFTTTNAQHYVFDRIGIHACFKNVWIRSKKQNVKIEELKHYNISTGLFKVVTPCNVQNSRFEDGSSVDGSFTTTPNRSMECVLYKESVQTIVTDITDGILYFDPASYDLQGRILENDYVAWYDDVDPEDRIAGIVESVFFSGGTWGIRIIDSQGKVAPVSPTTGILSVYRNYQSKPGSGYISTAGTFQRTYCFQIQAHSLLQDIPLLMIDGGISVMLELENINKVLVRNGITTRANDPLTSYTLSAVEYHAMMTQPTPQFARQKFKSLNENGLTINVQTRDTFLLARTLPQQTFQIHANAASVRRIFATCVENDLLNVSSNVCVANHSCSTFTRGYIDGYKFTVNHRSAPNFEFILDEDQAPLNRMYLQNALMDRQASMYKHTPQFPHMCIAPVDYYVRPQGSGQSYYRTLTTDTLLEPINFVIGHVLANDTGQDAFLTGADGRNLITVELRSSTDILGRQTHMIIVEYDVVLRIKNSVLTRMQN